MLVNNNNVINITIIIIHSGKTSETLHIMPAICVYVGR